MGGADVNSAHCSASVTLIAVLCTVLPLLKLVTREMCCKGCSPVLCGDDTHCCRLVCCIPCGPDEERILDVVPREDGARNSG